MSFVLASIIGVPTADQCFRMLAPFAGIIAMIWIIANADGWIRRLFPRPDWDEQLGWLRLRAERKARVLLRWCGYAVHGIFAILLLGMIWGAVAVGRWGTLQDTVSQREMVLRLPVLIVSLVFCAGYIVTELLPRLRREFDEEELVRYRAETPAEDEMGRKVKSARSVVGPITLMGSQKRDRR